MNLIDAVVTKIDNYKFEYDKHWLKVKYIDEGGEGTTNLMFNTIEEMNKVKVGYRFMH